MIKVCPTCALSFEAYRKTKYCSVACGAATTRLLICPTCSNEFVSNRSKTVYCSQACNNAPNKLSPLLRKARDAFFNQRCASRARGIGWEMTFEEWWEVWQKSGKWTERGRGHGKYQMARFGDSGPYNVANVKIITSDANLAERESLAGELSATAKLTNEDIVLIREAEGLISRTELAAHYGINYWYVRDIQKHRSRPKG